MTSPGSDRSGGKSLERTGEDVLLSTSTVRRRTVRTMSRVEVL